MKESGAGHARAYDLTGCSPPAPNVTQQIFLESCWFRDSLS